MHSEIKSYVKFKIEMEKKLPDYKPMERVIYMLRHPIHLKQLGGNYQMIADYIIENN